MNLVETVPIVNIPTLYPIAHFALDGSTLLIWWAKMIPLLLLTFGLVALFWWSLNRHSWTLASSSIILLVVMLMAMHQLGWTPRGYYVRLLTPSLRVGEEVFVQYTRHFSEQGVYPISTTTLVLPELDQFDVIVGERTNTEKCDGIGAGCVGLNIRISDSLAVLVMDGLIRCTLTNTQRAKNTVDNSSVSWHCRDAR